MQKIKTKVSIALSSAFMLAAVIACFPKNIAYAAENTLLVAEYTSQMDDGEYDTCQELIEYISSNLDEFVTEYNNFLVEELWGGDEGEHSDSEYLHVDSIEYSAVIYLVNDAYSEEDDYGYSFSYGIYLDFEGESGYMVATSEFEIYELEVESDLSYLREQDSIYYSCLDGFVYLDEDDVFQRYGYDELEEEPCFDWESLASTSDDDTIYPGQKEAGDGEIQTNEIEDYVAARYPNYTYVTSSYGNLSANFECSDQYDTSYYIKQYYTNSSFTTKTIWSSSEGNCALNTMYSVLNDWANYGYIDNVPIGLNITLSANIKSDSLYKKFGTGKIRSYSEYWQWQVNTAYYLNKIPVLYSTIRDYAVEQYGYTPTTGFYDEDVVSTLMYVANIVYGNSIWVKKSSSLLMATLLLNFDRSCYMIVHNSSTYGNHSVALVGYQIYRYSAQWSNFKYTKFAYFYEIADGWDTVTKYFDPNTSASPKLSVCYLWRF